MGLWTNRPIQNAQELSTMMYFKKLYEDYIERGGSPVFKRTDPDLHKSCLESSKCMLAHINRQISEYHQH